MLRKYRCCTQCLVIAWIVATAVFMWREPIYDEINMFYLENLQAQLVATFENRSSAFKSTCSLAADRRGPGQKIISFSIYGNFSDQHFDNRYLNPLKETVNTVIPQLYPGVNYVTMTLMSSISNNRLISVKI